MKQRMNKHEKFVEEENDFEEEDDNDGGALIFENTQYDKFIYFFKINFYCLIIHLLEALNLQKITLTCVCVQLKLRRE